MLLIYDCGYETSRTAHRLFEPADAEHVVLSSTRSVWSTLGRCHC